MNRERRNQNSMPPREPDLPRDAGGRAGPEPHEAKASRGSPIDAIKAHAIEAQVVEVLRNTYDPEIPVNIYDLGLIYDVDVEPARGVVNIRMTLTSPSCPVAESLPLEIQTRVGAIDGVNEVNIDIVWDPPWAPDRMSETARLQLGFM